jgi:hypothetical protein
VKRVAVNVGMDRNRFDPHRLARVDNPASNLASIRDQDLLKFRFARINLVDGVD